MTEDRIIHGIFAIVFTIAAVYFGRKDFSFGRIILLLGFAMLGSWVPDWDLILGIGFHRSPFTHSVLPVFFLSVLLSPRRLPSAVSGFSLGIASHLVLDTIDYGNVVGIPGGTADRLFLLGNAVAAIFLSSFAYRKATPSKNEANDPVSDADDDTATHTETKAGRQKNIPRKRMTQTQIFFAKNRFFFAELRAYFLIVLIVPAVLILIMLAASM